MLDLVPWIVATLLGLVVGTLGHIFFSLRRHRMGSWHKREDNPVEKKDD